MRVLGVFILFEALHEVHIYTIYQLEKFSVHVVVVVVIVVIVRMRTSSWIVSRPFPTVSAPLLWQ